MKKNHIPRMKLTSANRKGMKKSRFSKEGSEKNTRDIMTKTIPTANLYVRLSIINRKCTRGSNGIKNILRARNEEF